MSRRNRRSLPVVALAVALLSGCAASTWTQVGHDAGHSGHNPDERSLTTANVTTLDDVWSQDLLAEATEPMVRDGRVYVSTASETQVRIKAFDAAAGTSVWDGLVAEHGCGPPTFTDATFVGDELWTGYLFLRSAGPRPCGIWGNPTRVDPADGSVIAADQDNIGASPAAELDDGVDHATVQVRITLNPALGVEIVSLGDSSGTTWTGSVPGDIFGAGPPEVAPTARDGMVHVAYGNAVHSYSLYGCGSDPCAPVWSVDLQEKVTALVDAGPANQVYAAAGSTLYVIDRSTSQATAMPLAGPVSGMAVVGSTLYVGAGPSLYAYDLSGNGSSSWIRPLSSPATASPVVAGGVVYVGEQSGAVEAFDASSGNPLHTVSVTGEVDHVTVAAGKLLVVSPGTLTAFAPS